MYKTVQKLVSQKCFTWRHSGSLVFVFVPLWVPEEAATTISCRTFLYTHLIFYSRFLPFLFHFFKLFLRWAMCENSKSKDAHPSSFRSLDVIAVPAWSAESHSHLRPPTCCHVSKMQDWKCEAVSVPKKFTPLRVGWPPTPQVYFGPWEGLRVVFPRGGSPS